jgi:predicted CopG family antitoxin
MMTLKFSEVLEEYLQERERQNSDYYDNRFIGTKLQGRHNMEDLAKQLDEMVHGVEE